VLRPGTLAETIAPVDGLVRTRLVGFLDAFYLDPDVASQRARVEAEPARTGDARTDAYLGAVGEHLCNRWMLGDPPLWVDDPCRFLHSSWFMGSERMKAFMLRESPSAFRRRMIFTEAEPLRRIVMPTDGRYWHYEGLRTGMTPREGEIAPSRTWPGSTLRGERA